MIYIDKEKCNAFICNEHGEKDRKVEFIKKELELILFLIDVKGECVSREFLLDNLWSNIVSEASLNNLVKTTRAKLSSLIGSSDIVITVHKKGYRVDLKLISISDELAPTIKKKKPNHLLTFKLIIVTFFLLSLMVFMIFNLTFSSGRDFKATAKLHNYNNLRVNIFLIKWEYSFYAYDEHNHLLVRDVGYRFTVGSHSYLLNTSVDFYSHYPNANIFSIADSQYEPDLIRNYRFLEDNCILNVNGRILELSINKEKNKCILY
ncbi:winged helix-turn-helix domain-containing protein [Moritella dasanensis]|uniref:winged helix-turn-helix domain-containing protein n=1 Tax=Moritella dasanensis TaxID=428031 RepID=UPI0002FA8DC5|nr:helix-turn-helix domain-containing protein [Moritella dasanensis]